MARSWRFILEAAPDAVVIVDHEGTMVRINSRTEEMFGYGRKELVGRKIDLLVPDRTNRSAVEPRGLFAGALITRPMGEGLPLLSHRKDGTPIAVEMSLNPVETHDGIRTVVSIRDVSERQRMEAAAHAADDLMREAVEIQEDGFAVFDHDGRLVLHNSAFRAMVPAALASPLPGCTVEDIVEASAAAMAFESAEARFRFQAQYLEALRPESGTDPLWQDGRVYRVTRRRTKNHELVVTIADRTEDERREEELRRASTAKTEFLSAMSHELRTPLHAILGFASLLMRDRKTPLVERQQEMVQHVLKSCDHLMHLVDDVLDLSQIDSGRMTLAAEPVSLPEVLAEVMVSLQPAAARADITLRLAPFKRDLPAVFADRTRITQVLMNFGSNAIKYGRRGGRATFGVAPGDGGFVRLFVDDDGLGIAAERHPQVFQPFQRAGQEMGPIEGIGIGLALSQRLASLMDGRVGFRSVLGVGSSFWLELRPDGEGRSAPRPSPGAVVGERLAGSVGPHFDVVYVEDNPANVSFLRALLAEYERVTLHVAISAEVGLEIVQKHRPQVVILDVDLPGMSGVEAVHRLKERPETQGIPVIALATGEDLQRGRADGFDHYLARPVNVPKLLSLLEEILVG